MAEYHLKTFQVFQKQYLKKSTLIINVIQS